MKLGLDELLLEYHAISEAGDLELARQLNATLEEKIRTETDPARLQILVFCAYGCNRVLGNQERMRELWDLLRLENGE